MNIKKPFVIVFTGPSGVGKSEIEKRLFNDPKLNLGFSISVTTRKPRKNEVEGKDYYFKSLDTFQDLIKKDAFVEYNKHFENYYGTLKSEIERLQNQKKHPFLEIEVIGAKNVAKIYNSEELLSIFVVPPCFEDLTKRINFRNTEKNSEITKRLERAKYELSQQAFFKHVVVNDKPDLAARKVREIVLNRINENHESN